MYTAEGALGRRMVTLFFWLFFGLYMLTLGLHTFCSAARIWPIVFCLLSFARLRPRAKGEGLFAKE